jgi:hypothetical protein
MVSMQEAGLSEEHHRWVHFGLWALTGAAYAVGLLAAASMGLFILPAAIILTVLLLRGRTTDGLQGLLAGAGAPLLYVAYLNRSGPGTICQALSNGGERCDQEWSPWPWASVGVALILLSIVIFVVTGRSRHAEDTVRP